MATTKELTTIVEQLVERVNKLEERLNKAAEVHTALRQQMRGAFDALEANIPKHLEASLTSALSQMMAQHQATMRRAASRPMQPRTDFFMKALNQLRAEGNYAPHAMVPMADIKARMQVLKAAAEAPADAEDAAYDAPL